MPPVPRRRSTSRTWRTSQRWIEHGERSPSFQKILRCCQQANKDQLERVWIDTCCINGESSADQLSEAINSMFQWYENSDAYLHDVDDTIFPNKRGDSRGRASRPSGSRRETYNSKTHPSAHLYVHGSTSNLSWLVALVVGIWMA